MLEQWCLLHSWQEAGQHQCTQGLILAKADIFPNPNVNVIGDFLERRAGDGNRTRL